MKKKLTALFLAVVMCMTMSAPAFAVESTSVAAMEKAAYEDAVRADIMRQLEAQDAVHLYDAFAAILLPDDDSSFQPYATSSWEVNAPNGGILYYKLPYTYRGEDGIYEYAITHFNPDETDVLIACWDEFMDMVDFLNELFGDSFTGGLDVGITYVLEMASLGKSFSEDLIDEADGYSRVITVCGSVDNSSATVVAGWDTHPTAVVDDADTYNRMFRHFPSN